MISVLETQIGLNTKMTSYCALMLFGKSQNLWTSFTLIINLNFCMTLWPINIWFTTLDRCPCLLTSLNILRTGVPSTASLTSMVAFGNSLLDLCFKLHPISVITSPIKKVTRGTFASWHSKSLCSATRGPLSKLTKLISKTAASGIILATLNSKESLTLAVLIFSNQCSKCTRFVWCQAQWNLKAIQDCKLLSMATEPPRTARCSITEYI